MSAQNRVEQFRQLIEADPDDYTVHYGLGAEYLKVGDFAAAAEAFRRAIELKRDYTAAYRELGKACDNLGLRDQAISAYQTGLDVARATGDLQTGREMEVFLKRLGGAPQGSERCS